MQQIITLSHVKATGRLFIILMFTILMASCSKKDDVSPEPTKPEPPTGGSVPFYKLQRVDNFQAETDDSNPTAEKPPKYFNLENKEELPQLYATTSRWDLQFSGLYNADLSANATFNGALAIIEKPFEEVTDIPTEAEFSASRIAGADINGSFGGGIGWYFYDFGGALIGDGSYDKQHVAYALGNPITLKNGKTISRTLVVKTVNGNYAKVKMISVYKDALSPDQWFRNAPHMYFTFEYVLVPKGSKKFEIK
jgi:hypothetical protein